MLFHSRNDSDAALPRPYHSRLRESYGVWEADRKRMLGHSFGNDITNGVYRHRTLEELRAEIEKIKEDKDGTIENRLD